MIKKLNVKHQHMILTHGTEFRIGGDALSY